MQKTTAQTGSEAVSKGGAPDVAVIAASRVVLTRDGAASPWRRGAGRGTPRRHDAARGAGACLLALAALACTSCTADLKRYEFDEPLMGTKFRLVFYADDDARARAAADDAFARLHELNDIMSDYDAGSELSRLSRTSGGGAAVQVSDELWLVLRQSQHYWRLSNGAFDVTVGPVVRLWRRTRRLGELPRQRYLDQARAAVGFQHVRLIEGEQSVELVQPDMRLDLGGIAKGYACDEAIAVLRRHGYQRALVDGGGDIVVADAPPGADGWRIGVAPLAQDGPPTRYLLLTNCGVATSGDTWQFVEIDGTRYSHIVDPHTGVGLTDHSGVTVIAPDGMSADALASAVSVLGPSKGIDLVETQPDTAALVIRKPGDEVEIHESKRFTQIPLAPAKAEP